MILKSGHPAGGSANHRRATPTAGPRPPQGPACGLPCPGPLCWGSRRPSHRPCPPSLSEPRRGPGCRSALGTSVAVPTDAWKAAEWERACLPVQGHPQLLQTGDVTSAGTHAHHPTEHTACTGCYQDAWGFQGRGPGPAARATPPCGAPAVQGTDCWQDGLPAAGSLSGRWTWSRPLPPPGSLGAWLQGKPESKPGRYLFPIIVSSQP